MLPRVAHKGRLLLRPLGVTRKLDLTRKLLDSSWFPLEPAG